MIAAKRLRCTLILAAQQHAALGPFSAVMMGFVIPLSLITPAVSLLRRAPCA